MLCLPTFVLPRVVVTECAWLLVLVLLASAQAIQRPCVLTRLRDELSLKKIHLVLNSVHVPVADDTWPPSVPGWVYFPSCVSPGHHKAEPRETLARYQTLQALLYAASQQGDVVAVTTEGAGMMLQLGVQPRYRVHAGLLSCNYS
jgi:hypothetical protein